VDLKKRNSEMKGQLLRTLAISTRAIDEEKRTVELSFSSEEPYTRWWGVEILDHSEGCVDLKRLSEMGCALFNHNRDKVIGKVLSCSVENNRGIATVQFDEDDESEVIFKKVKGGSLKGVSVGYVVSNWEEVAKGKKSLDGRFTGPCEIAKRWMPYEISIVSVPADVTVGVGRSAEEQNGTGRTLGYFSRQLQYNKNRLQKNGGKQ
jgi:hypothetical protein